MGPSLEEAGTHQDSPALSFSGVGLTVCWMQGVPMTQSRVMSKAKER